MISNEYSIAISETLDILNHTEKEYVDKISSEFMKYLKENASKDYISNLDHTKSIKEMNLGIKTKTILAIIYEKFWCTPEEKSFFINHLIENEKEYQNKLREKYNPNNIFKNRNKQYSGDTIKTIAMIEYKESTLTKILNKIKKLFRK